MIRPRPDRTSVVFIGELHRVTVEKIHRIKIKSGIKHIRLSQKSDERNMSTLKSPAITILSKELNSIVSLSSPRVSTNELRECAVP